MSNNEIARRAGAAIRERRRALDRTQTAAALLAGVTRCTWSSWEAGRSFPHPQHFRPLAQALDWSEFDICLLYVAGRENGASSGGIG